MITENVSTLKIHKLTQEQYDRELLAGNIDEKALYLTPDEDVDLSGYATIDQLNKKADTTHNHDDIYYSKDATKEYINTAIQEYLKNPASDFTEPLEDDMPKVFIDGSIPSSKNDVLARLTYISKTLTFSSFITIKCQGTSSLSYPKKNFTIKLYEDEDRTIKLKKSFKGWGEQNKFCLKANWIDISHARNVVSARLWGDIVSSRSTFDSYPEEYKTSPNCGAVDGFPIQVYCNGLYWGRYTWNIPKDGWMSNMDDALEAHCILVSENYESGCLRAPAVID